jgi:hypothetical protein
MNFGSERILEGFQDFIEYISSFPNFWLTENVSKKV